MTVPEASEDFNHVDNIFKPGTDPVLEDEDAQAAEYEDNPGADDDEPGKNSAEYRPEDNSRGNMDENEDEDEGEDLGDMMVGKKAKTKAKKGKGGTRAAIDRIRAEQTDL
jgi:hypothetical protein